MIRSAWGPQLAIQNFRAVSCFIISMVTALSMSPSQAAIQGVQSLM